MTHECVPPLIAAGISYDDALALRRISMTLHRWHELECGDGNDFGSWCLTRGHKSNGAFTYDESGEPYLERHLHSENKARYELTADRERGALKRLAKIMARYPGLRSHVQGDPRGCALYILRDGDVPAGCDPDAYYSRGLGVYK